MGDAVAMINIGCLHWNGEGVPVDKEEALRWFRKAAECGRTDLLEVIMQGMRMPAG
jgi:TPR repeat protein